MFSCWGACAWLVKNDRSKYIFEWIGKWISFPEWNTLNQCYWFCVERLHCILRDRLQGLLLSGFLHTPFPLSTADRTGVPWISRLVPPRCQDRTNTPYQEARSSVVPLCSHWTCSSPLQLTLPSPLCAAPTATLWYMPFLGPMMRLTFLLSALCCLDWCFGSDLLEGCSSLPHGVGPPPPRMSW